MNKAQENLNNLLATMSGERPLIPETCAEALSRWDSGEGLFSIEMGGLGLGYEQCIQILVFELLRDSKDKALPKPEEYSVWGEAAITRCDKLVGGLSGAQVGAAKSLAWNAIKMGWAAAIASVPKERQIQVSRFFPQPPKAGE